MNGILALTERRLIDNLQATARGPKRNGLFALWLLVRACDGMLPPHGLSSRSNRRRLEGLRQRLSSLSIQPPLRRAFSGSLRELEVGTPEAACLVLRQLLAPVRDVLGAEAADAVASAERCSKDATRTAATNS